jgi:hypothetical protein
MTSMIKKKGGSFRALRDQHLPMFDKSVHRHDRGWPHPRTEPCREKEPKRLWRTVGIFHFRHDEVDDG